MPTPGNNVPNPIDRNALGLNRTRRNWQRLSQGAVTQTIKVNPPITNGPGGLNISVDGSTIIIDTNGNLHVIVSGSGSTSGPRTVWVTNETPSGTIDGVNAAFTLSVQPRGADISVFRDGVLMRLNDDYTLSGTTITFATAPAVLSVLLADYQWFAISDPMIVDGEALVGTINGSNTVFTIRHTPVVGPAVYRDGIRLLLNDDYTFSGTTVTFATAPATQSLLTASYGWTPPTAPAGTFTDGEIPAGLVNGSNVTFTLAQTPINSSLALYRDGVRLAPTTDYTLALTTITFNTAPATLSILQADYQY